MESKIIGLRGFYIRPMQARDFHFLWDNKQPQTPQNKT